MPVRIRIQRPGTDLSEFVRFPMRMYGSDAGYVPPLELEIRDRLTPKKNPLFEHVEAELMTAWRDGRMVGRCSVQVDQEHLKRHGDATGFFGFFDTTEDPEAAQALVNAASEWCHRRGMTRLLGPFSLSINEEIGLRVEGFDEPSVVFTPYHRPYQATLAEGCGLQKAKDLHLWRFDVGSIPQRARKAHSQILSLPEVRIRNMRIRNMRQEVELVREIFNAAWSENWCFVPWTDAEVSKVASDFRLILREPLALVAEVHERPVAISIAIPNLDEAIADLGGRLLPAGFLKLLWRAKVRVPSSGKLILLGVRPEVQRHRRYGGLTMALCVQIAQNAEQLGMKWGELGWTLEDNRLINASIRSMGAKPHKRLRMYEKTL